MYRKTMIKVFAVVSILACSVLVSTSLYAANKVLKIGFVGVTSGPAAAWGISNVRSMQTRAAWINETGGVKIGDTTYDIEIVTFDDQKDPKRAIAGMEKMAQDGIHYVVGPNVDDGAAAVRPVAEHNGIIYFPYAFPKALYTAPASNAVLGMVANYQSGPAIYKYLNERKALRPWPSSPPTNPIRSASATAALLPPRLSGSKSFLRQRHLSGRHHRLHPGADACHATQPDLLVLSGVSPANAPQLIRSARELGFQGLISTETAQDAGVLAEGAGDLANGFISVGGASTPELASPMMAEFVQRYTDMFGEYNDESNTKVYALEYILETLKANPAAIDECRGVQEDHGHVSKRQPLHEGRREAALCRHDVVRPEAPVSVPLVVNVYQGRQVRDAVRR